MNEISGEILHGVGVGPGDPELLTLKAVRLIKEADLIAFPAPETGESFARRIAATYMSNGVEEYAIRMNLGDGTFPKDEIYDSAAEHLAGAARSGKRVVVLCEGDPFFYGSFLYLFHRLANSARVVVVPGVSSLMACAAVSGQPLAARNDVLSIVPAPLGEEELRRRLLECEAAAIIKVGRHLAKVRRVLTDIGLLEHSRYIERATLAEERILPLSDLQSDTAPYFSMVLVHRRQATWDSAQ